jgi:hypothetical protein
MTCAVANEPLNITRTQTKTHVCATKFLRINTPHTGNMGQARNGREAVFLEKLLHKLHNKE